MFEATAIRAVAEAAGPQLEAMVLLGINCGLCNQDVATLPKSALDLKSAWLDYPRPKTGVPRRCPLWPEPLLRSTARPNFDLNQRIYTTASLYL